MTGIQAIIFDFGGVLLDWNPRHLYRKLFTDEAAIEAFLLEVGFHEWNLAMDKGKPFAESVAQLTAQFPHHHTLITAFDQRWPECISGPIQGTVEILRTLKEKQYPISGLSNWAVETFYRVRPQYEFFNWFDTILLSGEVKLIKPDPRIFTLMLEKIGHKAEECLLIDDSAANIQAASRLGFHTIRFESPTQLHTALHELKLL